MKNIKKFLLTSLSAIFGVSLIATQMIPLNNAFASDYTPNWGNHELVQQADFELRDGATESQFISYGPSAGSQVWYSRSVATTYDLDKITVLTSYKGYDTLLKEGVYSTSTVKDQVDFVTENYGYDVVGAINGTIFDTSNGQPNYGLMINGVEYCPKYYFTNGFFGIVKNEQGDQKAVIGKTEEYAAFRDGTVSSREENGKIENYSGYKLWQAIGGFSTGTSLLIYNNELCPENTWNEEHPRTAIGIKADGSVLTFVNEGRNGNRAGGLNLYSVATIMKELGCIYAMNLDGGGSSTTLSKHAGENEYKNRIEAAYGADRSVGDAILFVSSASMTPEGVDSDGVFEKAHILPNQDLYCVGTTVQFSAKGSDSYGNPANLPEGLVWELDTTKSTAGIGTIDPQTGLFKANGTISGKVAVNLKNGNEIVGSSKIDLAWPDWNYSNAFPTSFSLGFNESKELEFTLYPANNDSNKQLGISTWRPMIIQDCDVEWNVPKGCSVRQNANGVFVFYSGDDIVVNGEISLSKIVATGQTSVMTKKAYVSVGKAPTLLYDFENSGWEGTEWGKGGTAKNLYKGTKANGDKVLFGEGSMAISYNMDGYNYIGNMNPSYKNNPTITFYNDNLGFNPVVPADAKYFGLWAWIPEGFDGCWFRLTLQGTSNGSAGSTATTTLSQFIEMPKNPKVDRGIYGSGEWRFYYTEIGFDTRYGTPWTIQGPYSIYNVQIMWSAFADTVLGYEYNQPDNAETKEAARAQIEANFNKVKQGTIYIDNIMALYGNPSEDMLSPYMGDISSKKVSDNNYTLSFKVLDDDRFDKDTKVGIMYEEMTTLGEYQTISGVNFDTLKVYYNDNLLDNGKYEIDSSSGLVSITNLQPKSGDKIRIVASDKNANTIDYTKTIREVLFDIGENSEFQERYYVGVGDKISFDYPEIEGYTFSNWSDEIPSIMGNEDVVIYGDYSINKYNLTFIYDDNEIFNEEVYFNSEIQIPLLDNYHKEGYTFKSWDIDVPSNMPARDLTINATFTINQYKVTIIDTIGNIISQEYLDYNSEVKLPTQEGYTFTWANDESTPIVPAQDITIRVYKNFNQHKVTLIDQNGFIVSEYILNYNSDIELPIIEGFNISWDESVTSTKVPDKDVSLLVQKDINVEYVTHLINQIEKATDIDELFNALKFAKLLMDKFNNVELNSISELANKYNKYLSTYQTIVQEAPQEIEDATQVANFMVPGLVSVSIVTSLSILGVAIKRRMF